MTIPVVVHVVYRTSTENISDAQIQTQLDVLNADFRRLNSDADGTWSQAADAEIEFCLATSDPSGNATTGITRTSTTVNGPTESSLVSSTWGVLIGTKDDIVETADYRTPPEKRWNGQLVLDVATSFAQYVLSTADAELAMIDAQTVVPEGAPPQIAEGFPVACVPRMERSDFLGFGYTGGFPG